jgi:hypothetical protein
VDDLVYASDPLGVPMTTRTSPASSASLGGGEAITSSPRTMATIDAPVRVRARVSPSGRPANREPGSIPICPALSPGTLFRQVGEPLGDPGRAEDLGHRVAFLGGEPQQQPGLVGIPAVIGDHFEVALPTGHNPDTAALRRGELVAQPDARQQHLIDVHPDIMVWRCS